MLWAQGWTFRVRDPEAPPVAHLKAKGEALPDPV